MCISMMKVTLQAVESAVDHTLQVPIYQDDIQLIQYFFMYHNNLCLTFEIFGLKDKKFSNLS